MIHAMSNVQEDLQRDNLGDPSYDEAIQLAMDKRQPEYIGDLMERALNFPELKMRDNRFPGQMTYNWSESYIHDYHLNTPVSVIFNVSALATYSCLMLSTGYIPSTLLAMI